MKDNLEIPTVPIDNQFHSTGGFTEFKQPSADHPLIHARVTCNSPAARTYLIQFRSFHPQRIRIRSSASHQGGDGRNADAEVPPNGGVSRLTRVAAPCGNVASPDVFITIDEVILL